MDTLPFRTAAIPTIKRLPLYLRKIREHIDLGEVDISSATLARELHLDPIVVRKDLAITGVIGIPRRGFPAMKLTDAIVSFLGWDNTTDAILCGVGSLGKALLGYQGFHQHGLSIVAAFDVDPDLIGTKERGVKVFPLSKLQSLVPRLNIRIGILTVPVTVAQLVADQLVAAGIQGIWNFTPAKLSVPPEVVIQRVDLASSLAVLSHTLAVRNAAHAK